jgi:uncharacterized membrane protein YkoI
MKMKKYLMAIIGVSIFNIASFCQIKVPEVVRSAFGSKFPAAANVKWGKENANEYEAEFKQNNSDVSANFKTDGAWIETETVLDGSELPAAVNKAIKTKYPNATITKAEKLEKPGKVLYEVIINQNGKTREVGLNADGSFVK